MSRPPAPIHLPCPSVEFVCERWGNGEEVIWRYAPIRREHGKVWIHPTLARQIPWDEVTRLAHRVWLISGTLWNPGTFTLIHQRGGRP